MSNKREIIFNNFFKIPKEFLIDSYISKEKFYYFGNLNSSNKKLFKDYVRQLFNSSSEGISFLTHSSRSSRLIHL